MNRLIYEEIVALLLGTTAARGVNILGERKAYGERYWGFRYTYAYAMIDKFNALKILCSTGSTPN